MPLPTPKELKAALSAATKEAAERKAEADAAWAAIEAAREAYQPLRVRLDKTLAMQRTLEAAVKAAGWPDKERAEFLGPGFNPVNAPTWAVRRVAARSGRWESNKWHDSFIAARAYLLALMETP